MTGWNKNESDGLIQRITRDLEETKDIVVDTVQKLLQRGEQLDHLTDKTQHLLEQSERFEESVRGPPSRTNVMLGRLARGVSNGVRWTARQTVFLIYFVLYYVSRVGTLGTKILSALFPLHDGLSTERFDKMDIYYGDSLFMEHDEGWYDSEYTPIVHRADGGERKKR
ncbi:MAG: R-SNARE family protein [Promethearchaeota archaeon]